jgi:hypothetical protein
VKAIRLKGDVESREGTPKKRASLETLFSLNVAFAVVSALFIYDGAHHLADAPKIVRECLEAFTRMLVDIAPLGVHGRTKSELLRSRVIREAVFVCLTFLTGLFLYSLTKLVTRTDSGRRVFLPLSGVAAFVAVPSC